jgi:hypothetical protein
MSYQPIAIRIAVLWHLQKCQDIALQIDQLRYKAIVIAISKAYGFADNIFQLLKRVFFSAMMSGLFVDKGAAVWLNHC